MHSSSLPSCDRAEAHNDEGNSLTARRYAQARDESTKAAELHPQLSPKEQTQLSGFEEQLAEQDLVVEGIMAAAERLRLGGYPDLDPQTVECLRSQITSWFQDDVHTTLQRCGIPGDVRTTVVTAARMPHAMFVVEDRGSSEIIRAIDRVTAFGIPVSFTNDKVCLDYTIAMIDSLLLRWNPRSPLFLSSDSPALTRAIEDVAILTCREGIVDIATAISRLSKAMREEAEKHMQGQPMTCHTIEALGGLMIPRSCRYPVSLPASSIEERIVVEKLLRLLMDTEDIVDNAVLDIVRDDLPQLQAVFKFLARKTTSPPKARLNAIKALVYHINDARSLQLLLSLSRGYVLPTDGVVTGPTEPPHVSSVPKERNIGCGPGSVIRLFQEVGELVCARRLSNRTKDLAPDLDFEALARLRDGFTHIEEIGYYSVAMRCVSDDEGILYTILLEYFEELHPRLVKLVADRWPVNYDCSWSGLYRTSSPRSRGQGNSQVTTTMSATDTEELGPRESKGKGKKKQEQKQNIARDQRQALRRAQVASNPNKQKKAKVRAYTGLEKTRALAREFRQVANEGPEKKLLDLHTMLRLACSVLRSVRGLLTDDEVLGPLLPQLEGLTLHEWGTDPASGEKGQFYHRLATFPALLYAIEFFSGWLATLLWWMTDDSEVSEVITTVVDRNSIRSLRNYTAHGHGLYDLSAPDQHTIRPRHIVVTPVVVVWIRTLLPVLEKLRGSCSPSSSN